MALVVTFGVALLIAVLFSALSARSPLSTSLIFLIAGLVAGPLVLGVNRLDAATVREVASVTLFAVLFADGQRAPWRVLRRRWREPTRALLLAMPLTFVLVGALAHFLIGLDWISSLLIGAVLAPTDPVFAAALVGRDDVPSRLRSLLNIESGLNDGLALPVVLLLIGTLGGRPSGESTELGPLLGEILLGLVLGVVLPLAATALLRVPLWGVEPGLAPLGPFAVAVLLFAACEATGANLYLAAFAAGITLATVSPQGSDAFARAGELISELAKNFALLAFGTLITSSVLGQVGVLGWVLAALTLLIGRPLPVMVALIGSRLDQRQRMAASWFGPKGFASVVYGLIVLESGIADADVLFALIVATVAVSIALHSTTDVPVAVMLGQYPDDAEPDPTDDARFDATTHDDGDARDRVQDRASRNPRRPMSFTTRVDATAVGRTASGRGLRTAALWGHDIQPSRRIRRSVSRLILATMPSCRRWSPSSTGDDVEAGETGGDVRAIRRIYSRICSPTRRARDPLQPSALVHRHARTSTLGR